jgi:hypothetical protein
MRCFTRLAVSAFARQIGARVALMSAASTAATGRAPSSG